MSDESSPARRRSFVFPLLLIALGVFLLLRQFGLLPRDAWDVLWRLWPVLLVLVGLDIILRSLGRGRVSQVLRLVVMGFLVFFLFLAVVFHGHCGLLGRLDEGERDGRREVTVPLGETRSARLRVDFDGHRGVVGPLAGRSLLMAADLRYRGRLVEEIRHEEGEASIRLEARSGGIRWVGFPFVSLRDDRRWRIELSPEAALRLDLESGSGGLELDLSELRVEELRLDAGSGAVELALPRRGLPAGRLDTGSGRVTLRVPDGLALRIERHAGTGSFRPGERLKRVGEDEPEIWQTEDVPGGEPLARLFLDQGSGSVRVR